MRLRSHPNEPRGRLRLCCPLSQCLQRRRKDEGDEGGSIVLQLRECKQMELPKVGDLRIGVGVVGRPRSHDEHLIVLYIGNEC